ncbi:MAG: HAD family acid phosphatase [Candidatus Sphingomonas colombiensis]|nr:HAD family acid phosphatase [Sphingomonas sp.]WEK45018.1 MAG: HAD family acid phosphatase [Sphingomonas sp.]
MLGLTACATAPVAPVASSPAAVAPAQIAPGFQYLYGSAEGAAISIQAWNALVAYAARQVRARPRDSVLLAEGATLAAPVWEPCGAKPFAAVFDVDETVLLNLGYEADDAQHPGRAFDDTLWDRWERTGMGKVSPTPGAQVALAALRALGVTVVFNTNRAAKNAAETAATIEAAGIGPAKHGDTLYLTGDDATGSHKDGRRAMIAQRFCVIAMGGDQLGDFSDLFNAGQQPAARRAAASAPAIARLWGAGWFVLPNPVYGAALKGGLDDIFPADKRWSDPGARKE